MSDPYDEQRPAEPAPDDRADAPDDPRPVPPPFLGIFGGEPEQRPEDTRPLEGAGDPWARPEPTQPGDQPGPDPYPGWHHDPYAGWQPDPYAGWQQHQGWDPGHTAWAGYAAPQEPAPARRGPTGWVWPVVAVLALVAGLLGGLIGGTIVAEDAGSDGTSGPIPAPGASAPGGGPGRTSGVADVADRLLPSTVQVLARGGAGSGGGATGSGFVVDRRGHVITNNHVVAEATGKGQLTVVDNAGRTHGARIVGRSPVYDIAVLDVDGARSLEAAAIGSSRALRVGETVVALGSPLGLSSTVTSGIVSALDRPVTTGGSGGSSYIDAVQTDAAINPGNSGGPLVNMRGEVVGVNSAIATTGSSIGGQSGSIGVGFAIPMEQVRITANQIIATGRAQYPVIGANVDTGSATEGAEVTAVPPGTPAEKAGLRSGDVVVEAGGTRVTDGIGLIVAIRTHRPGETLTLVVERDGERREVQVRLDAKVG